MMKYSIAIFLCALASLYVCRSSVIVNAPSKLNDKKIMTAAVYYDDGDDDGGQVSDDAFQTKNSSLLKNTDPEDKETVLKLSNFALNTLDKLDPDSTSRSLIDIVDSKKEFVNGILYHLTLLVAVTKREPPSMNQDSNDVDYIEKNICKVKVLRTWATAESLEPAQVVSSQCTPERQKRSIMVGEKVEVDVQREDIKKAADLGLKKLVEMSGSDVAEKRIGRILKAKTQVVAGTLYEITSEICDVGGESCETCTITSVEQVWLDSFEVIQSDCRSLPSVVGKNSSKIKRSYSNELEQREKSKGMLSNK